MHPRHQDILQRLQDGTEIAVRELADRLGVTPVTIRRDLDELAHHGLVERTHGGVILAHRGRIEFTFRQRESTMTQAKRAIAAVAAQQIPADAAVTLDTGSTTLEVARALTGHDPLRVLTCSLPIAATLHPLENIQLILLGGQTHNDQPDLFGELTEDNLRRFHVDVAIIGTDAADPEGLMTTDPDTARVSRAMISHAERTILVADSTKFTRKSFVRFAEWDAIDMVICDRELDLESRAWLETVAELVIVP